MTKLFLCEIEIDPRTYAGRTALADVGQLHRSVMAGFDPHLGDRPREAAGVLFRLEVGDARQRVLVQSSVPFDPSRLAGGFTLTGQRQLQMSWRAGDRIRYRMTANTTKKVRLDRKKRHVQAVVGDDVVAWWLPRLSRAGVRSDSAPFIQPTWARGRGTGGSQLTFCGHQIDGTGVVESAEQLREAVTNGIGRGRAYGFGLLSVAVFR